MDNGENVIMYPKKKVKQSQKRKETVAKKTRNVMAHAAKKAKKNNWINDVEFGEIFKYFGA